MYVLTPPLGEATEQVDLGLRQLGRHLHAHPNPQVALRAQLIASAIMQEIRR